MSRSSNGGSSSEGEDSEVESMGSSVLHNLQQGFMDGGQWGIMAAYSMVAVGEHASLLLCLTQIGMSIDLAKSKVLPM